MENENRLIAGHESARVVFAYLYGYTCDVMELPAKGSNSNSKLNAGSDTFLVQAVLSGNPQKLPTENLQHGIEVAGKLMKIYCAGSCADFFLENDAKVPSEPEVNISGHDLAMLEKIQGFLKKAIVDHSDDFPSQTIISIFRKLKAPEVWKAIEMLTLKLLQQEDKRLSRFHIEDTLMQAGIKIQNVTAKSGFSLAVHEDNNSAEPAAQETKVTSFNSTDLTPLDVMVRDFLRKIKSDWHEEDLHAATVYLHKLYKKYGR